MLYNCLIKCGIARYVGCIVARENGRGRFLLSRPFYFVFLFIWTNFNRKEGQ